MSDRHCFRRADERLARIPPFASSVFQAAPSITSGSNIRKLTNCTLSCSGKSPLVSTEIAYRLSNEARLERSPMSYELSRLHAFVIYKMKEGRSFSRHLADSRLTVTSIESKFRSERNESNFAISWLNSLSEFWPKATQGGAGMSVGKMQTAAIAPW